MKHRNRLELRLIELRVSEIDLPEDLDAIPERSLDVGVVVPAMVDYLKLADRLPICARVTWDGSKFSVADGARTLWAARCSQWPRPMVVVFAADPRTTPAEIWARTAPLGAKIDAEDRDPIERLVHVLHFARPLSALEKEFVESQLKQLAESLRARSIVRFSEVSNLIWISDRAVSWFAPVQFNIEDRGGTLEWSQTLANIRAYELPVLAFNGRAC